MKPAPFDYERPASLAEAYQSLARHGSNARVLAGGQSLVPMMNLRLVKPGALVDINRIPGLDGIRVADGHLVIGALARHADLLASPLVKQHCPLMADAYPNVAHGPVRNRGTLAGNISHADPSSEMPAVLAACEATIVAGSERGTRAIAATDFFTGPMSTSLATGEMVIEIRVPVAPAGQGACWLETTNRQGDFVMAGVGVTLQLRGGRCTHARLAVAGMDRGGLRLPGVEQQLVGKALDAATIDAAANQAGALVTPTDSYHADALYKRELVATLTGRALASALRRCQ